MFSATFPTNVENIARRILVSPIEIIVGGRSIVCSDVAQAIEVINEENKFKRLLELLKEWVPKGRVIIFVDRQDSADLLFAKLFTAEYPCLSLHGGKDQLDRDTTIKEFKTGNKFVLVATSVAARGLDVKDLKLVVNYDIPSHYEDYVHRVGRTGRAGQKGTAITFISSEEGKFAPDLVKALELSETPIPKELKELCDNFLQSNPSEAAKSHTSGYGGKGFKFDEREEAERQEELKRQKQAWGEEDEEQTIEEDDDFEKPIETITTTTTTVVTPVTGTTTGTTTGTNGVAISSSSASSMLSSFMNVPTHLIDQQEKLLGKVSASKTHFSAEIEINDYPQHARWKVTHKDALSTIGEWTNASVTTKGAYITPGKQPGPGERKLYLHIESTNEHEVIRARSEIKRILQEALATAVVMPDRQIGKYKV
eukprot:TRINITY_DN1380_c0_g2_i1.p1 TRINITY_DN1380_c0_g2~~TRINITY_DN1380_c0_g2_i1.p1  ORF type:complete len:425 (-),score=218.30 TRINITY_DN1380_c0_g2_i1:35-1309(-)